MRCGVPHVPSPGVRPPTQKNPCCHVPTHLFTHPHPSDDDAFLVTIIASKEADVSVVSLQLCNRRLVSYRCFPRISSKLCELSGGTWSCFPCCAGRSVTSLFIPVPPGSTGVLTREWWQTRRDVTQQPAREQQSSLRLLSMNNSHLLTSLGETATTSDSRALGFGD